MIQFVRGGYYVVKKSKFVYCIWKCIRKEYKIIVNITTTSLIIQYSKSTICFSFLVSR
jgi:hypothetical protein